VSQGCEWIKVRQVTRAVYTVQTFLLASLLKKLVYNVGIHIWLWLILEARSEDGLWVHRQKARAGCHMTPFPVQHTLQAAKGIHMLVTHTHTPVGLEHGAWWCLWRRSGAGF